MVLIFDYYVINIFYLRLGSNLLNDLHSLGNLGP